MKTPVIPNARVQQWRKKLIPQFILSSLWGQFSNQYTANMTVPGAKERPIPNAVVMKVTDDFSNGAYKTTVVAPRKPSITAIIGPNPAAGREYRPTMDQVGAYWNVQRIPMSMTDESVEGDILNFYKWAEQTAGWITTAFVEEDDYDHQRATIEGADQSLTDPAFWQDSEKGSSIDNPLAATLHPNTYTWVSGALVKSTWSATYATALANWESKLDDMAVSDTCNMNLLDQVHFKATRTVCPLGGMQGDSEIKWVLKLSDGQWLQLMTDSAAGSVQDRLKYTDKSIEKVITGAMGVYRNMLIVVDQRSPLANWASDILTFQYITPASDARVPVLSNGTGNTGTAQLAMLYGNMSLIQGIKQELDFVQKKSEDYGFENSLCGVLKRAVRRCDLDTSETATSARVNESSFIVATATNAVLVG